MVSGEYTLKELAVAAIELKVINKIKAAFVNELSCSDWDQAETLYPTISTDVKQWIFAFQKLKKGAEAPETFKKYCTSLLKARQQITSSRLK